MKPSINKMILMERSAIDMSDAYTTLEKKIAGLPENCLDEVSAFVDFMYFRVSNNKSRSELASTDYSTQIEAVNDAFGLWADHDNDLSVDETVRTMRRGRRFDI